jgi:hypothetical protein
MHYAAGRHMRRGSAAELRRSGGVQKRPRRNCAGDFRHADGGHSAGLQFVKVNIRRGIVVLASDVTHFYETMESARPFTTAFHVGDLLEAFDTLREHAPTPQHIVLGHVPR